jgi:hypothetical protein
MKAPPTTEMIASGMRMGFLRQIPLDSTTRPTLQSRFNNGKPLTSPYISGTRHLTIMQKIGDVGEDEGTTNN